MFPVPDCRRFVPVVLDVEAAGFVPDVVLDPATVVTTSGDPMSTSTMLRPRIADQLMSRASVSESAPRSKIESTEDDDDTA
jgi:hypothetical protein